MPFQTKYPLRARAIRVMREFRERSLSRLVDWDAKIAGVRRVDPALADEMARLKEIERLRAQRSYQRHAEARCRQRIRHDQFEAYARWLTIREIPYRCMNCGAEWCNLQYRHGDGTPRRKFCSYNCANNHRNRAARRRQKDEP